MKPSTLLLSLLLLMRQVWNCTACLWPAQPLSGTRTYAWQAEGTICPAFGVLRHITLAQRKLPVALQESIDPFRLYYSHEFGDHAGIGILGAADQVDHLGRSVAFYEDDGLSTQTIEGSGLLEVVDCPGRGRGLITRRTIQRGELVMARQPVLLLDLDVYTDLDRARWVELHHEAVAALPPGTRSMFWELNSIDRVDALTDRIRTNAFVVMISNKRYHAIIPEISVRVT